MASLSLEQATALVGLLEAEWKDLHHSRVQEWSALGVVTGAHLALTQIPKFLKDADVMLPVLPAAIVGCLIGIGFAVIGALITCRHRRLMQIKLEWIFGAESRLGLSQGPDCPVGVIPPSAQVQSNLAWRGLSVPRLLSTSGLILSWYGIFIFIDLTCLVFLIQSR